MRFVPFLLLTFSLLFGSLTSKSSYDVDRFIADSLDLPLEFLQSERFLKVYMEFASRKNRTFIDVDRMESYFIPELDKILEARNIPEVFLFMAMVESNFALHAKSYKKAVGIWQFMPKTAQKYGLRIDEFVDERKDPLKATNAAVKYLLYLHKMFGKWYLAALAYNAGEGTVLRAIKRAKSDDVFTLLDPEQKYLPKESRRYLYKIAALAKLSYDPDSKLYREIEYIFTRSDDYMIVPVKVGAMESLRYIAQKIRFKYDYLRLLNPHIKRGFTPPIKSYSLYIPKFKFEDFQKNYTPSNKYENFVVYRVSKGDSLYTIARRYKTKVATLKKLNNLRSNIIRVGQKLIIPLLKSQKRLYRVKKGDTIISIAKRFGVDPKKLKKWNNKKDNFLKVGEKLVVLY